MCYNLYSKRPNMTLFIEMAIAYYRPSGIYLQILRTKSFSEGVVEKHLRTRHARYKSPLRRRTREQ